MDEGQDALFDKEHHGRTSAIGYSGLGTERVAQADRMDHSHVEDERGDFREDYDLPAFDGVRLKYNYRYQFEDWQPGPKVLYSINDVNFTA